MTNDNSIWHHGIKGQEWGVKNGPPYPLSDKEHAKVVKKATKQFKKVTKKANKGHRDASLNEDHLIPAGTKLYRVTTDADETLDGHKYVSYIDGDRAYYRGFYSDTRKQFDGDTSENNTAYELEYSLKDDLRVPSRETLMDISVNIIKNDKNFLNEVTTQGALNTITSWMYMDDAHSKSPSGDVASIFGADYNTVKNHYVNMYYKGNEDLGNKHFSIEMEEITGRATKAITEAPLKQAYGWICTTYVKSNGTRNAVFNALKEKGYNAIMDEEDIRNRTTYAPMIIFDGGSSLAVTGKQEITKELHDQSRVQYEDAQKEMIRSRGWKKNWK